MSVFGWRQNIIGLSWFFLKVVVIAIQFSIDECLNNEISYINFSTVKVYQVYTKLIKLTNCEQNIYLKVY